MTANEMERIKGLISKAEIESAKAQGVIDDIKSGWREKYGTDDVSEIRKIADGKAEEAGRLREKLDALWQKIQSSYDWDALEREIG